MKTKRICTAILLVLCMLLSACASGAQTNGELTEVPEKYLPIGTVVLLVDGDQPLMIYARGVYFDTGETRDYSAVLYPYGRIEDEYIYSFDHEDIEKVLHLGYISEIEIQVNEFLKEKLK